MQEDAFTLMLPDVGMPTHLAVRSDGQGAATAWHLDMMVLTVHANQAAQASGQVSCHAGAAAGAVAGSGSARPGSPARELASSPTSSLARQLHSPEVGSSSGTCRNAPGQMVWFVAQRWLSPLQGLEVLLPASYSDPAQQLHDYRLTAYTSDVRAAGTDARVSVELIGQAGSSGMRVLESGTSATAFERGGVDVFDLR